MGLDIVELVLAIEEEFRVHLPNGEVAKMERVGDVADWILAEMAREGRGFMSEEEVWDRLQEIIVRQTGVPYVEVTREAKFVDDLGLD